MPGQGDASSKGRRRGKGRRGRGDDDYGYEYGRKQNLIRPPDQEKLTEAQLKEEFTRRLTTADPGRAQNKVVWDFKERGFKLAQDEEQTITMFHLDSELVFKDHPEEGYRFPLSEEIEDPEYKEKKDKKDKGKPTTAPPNQEGTKVAPPPTPAAPPSVVEGEEGAKGDVEGEEGEEKDDTKLPKEEKPTKLLNQFTFCDRASQTASNPFREHSAQTIPPPRGNYKDYCNAWIINDQYEHDSETRPKEKKKVIVEDEEEGEMKKEEEEAKAKELMEKMKEKKPGEGEDKVHLRKPSVLEGGAAQEAALAKSGEGLKVLERLAMHNIYGDVLHDFKYYDDPSDEFRETGEGTLLPLWKFVYDKAKKHHVTSISWSDSEPDLFAVSYGSYNFLHPILDGMVLIWSLRNPAFPEYIWVTPKGVMACAIHPDQDCLVAVGLYDGNVALLQLQQNVENMNKSIILRNSYHHQSNGAGVVIKHRSPIWSVRWAENDLENRPNFFSCGMDGQIINWTVDPFEATPDAEHGGGLNGIIISTLYLPSPPVQGPDGISYRLFGCARCMTIHPKEKSVFLVGTAEGNIFMCSMLYGSRFKRIYNAHFLPVAALEWNYFHPDVFISCSEDWTIKVWDRNDLEPMYVFEIGVPILDCAWAPYSSTVFAGVSEEGKALVYDLNVNKEKPICCQQVVTKKKVRPYRISFNPHYPVVTVGDDRGQLTTLKLSPNLRILPKDKKGRIQQGEARMNYEIGKMTKLLSLVKDPESIKNPTKLLSTEDEEQAKAVVAVMTGNKK